MMMPPQHMGIHSLMPHAAGMGAHSGIGTPHGIGGMQHFDDGGTVPDDPNAGIAPSASTQNPTAQNEIQRYAGMSTEELQELAVRLGPTAQGQLVQKILQQKRTRPGMAFGGMMSPSEGVPSWTRTEERETSGLLHSGVAGRTDQLKVNAPVDSYVVPADVVSGLGEGNSLSGARVLQKAFGVGPYGVPLPKMNARTSAPRPPALPRAKGGATPTDRVPILAAGGEFIIHPEHIVKKFGSVKRGHAILDAWVKHERAKIIKTMKSLPGPSKD